jgi:hypothetical protein
MKGRLHNAPPDTHACLIPYPLAVLRIRAANMFKLVTRPYLRLGNQEGRQMNRLIPALALTILAITPALASSDVDVPRFSSVSLSGGGHVVVRFGSQPRVQLINGSTDVTSFNVNEDGQLKIKACSSACPAQYNLEVEITSPNPKALAVDGGGRIETDGMFPGCHKFDAAVSGGGTLDARSIHAETINAAVSGGGDIKVSPDKALNAAVNEGGSIRYWGNPQVKNAVSGGGTVERGG